MSNNRTLISLLEQHANRFESEYAASPDARLSLGHDQCALKLRHWMKELRSRDPDAHEFLPSKVGLRAGETHTWAAPRLERAAVSRSEAEPSLAYYAGEMLNNWGRSVLTAVDWWITTRRYCSRMERRTRYVAKTEALSERTGRGIAAASICRPAPHPERVTRSSPPSSFYKKETQPRVRRVS